MYTIGELASLGRVSVRMLRHYDAIGLLTPAQVDPVSGYRRYAAPQYSRLIRLVGFKSLGFTLDEVRVLLDADERVVAAKLEQRRGELLASIAADTDRLDRIDARLRISGRNIAMHDDIALTELAPTTVARISDEVPSGGPDNVGPVIGPMFERLGAALADAGIAPAGPPISFYDATDSGEALRVNAAFPIVADTPFSSSFDSYELPAASLAASTTYSGAMSGIGTAWQELHEWIVQNGYEPDGVAREVYLRSAPHPQEEWVTQLQQPIRHV